ncbi:uncharacterized protein LOC122243344 isoform X1 [Penaeus japonicus]|uniref:uncharacterized protein LOC122243344 isoform X1 n=1 Tax=Penaeus japonicus TaxID=27405 RepID=UPI001C711CB3|nr:uncharacterized protein LOC122243344 isoform X1 [Penaeus japonicus]
MKHTTEEGNRRGKRRGQGQQEEDKGEGKEKIRRKGEKKKESIKEQGQPYPWVRALSCVPCAQTTCQKRSMVKYCSYGFVLDMCGCCFVCGKGPGAACGGQWAWHGRCGRGLECRYPEVPKGDVSPPFFLSGLPGRCVSTNTTISDKINVFFSWISSFIQNTIMGRD